MIYLDQSPNRWTAGTFVVSLLVVVILTLAPFNFDFEDRLSLAELASRFSHRSSTNDWIANILLYMPLGFSLAAWLWAKRVSKSAQFACVLFCAFSVSTTVEILQAYSPSRVSASTDIYANSMGALLGMLCFNSWGRSATFDFFRLVEELLRRFIQQKVAALSIQKLTLVLMGYVLLLFLISSGLQRVIHFGNWTDPYFLMIGHAQAIGAPWEGYISKLSIADQAVSEEEVAQIFAEKRLPEALQSSLVASYDLTSYRDSYVDKTGYSPNLIWQGNSTQPAGKGGSLVNTGQWLESETTVSLINQRVRQSSQFALSAVLAAADVEQPSPAPILSLSNQSSERRNLAFAQRGSELVLWLRTSVNNSGGTKPELVIPNVFKDTDFHHLLITYDGFRLRVYVDKLQNQFSFELNSGIVLFQSLLPLEKLKNAGLVVCKVLYYALLFIPLGILIGLVLSWGKRRLAYGLMLLVESVILVPLALESLLMLESGELSLASFSLGAVLTATAILGVLIFRKL